jgi:outer membrane protein assembly factor BamB
MIMLKKICSALFVCLVSVACTNKEKILQYTGFHADATHKGIYKANTFHNFDTVQWKYATNGKVFSSPAVCDGIVYAGSEDSNLYALQATDGSLKWKLHTNGAVASSPAVYNGLVYCCSYDGYCYAVHAGNGEVAWKFKTGGEKKVGAYGLWTMKPSGLYMEDLYDFFLSSPVVDAGNKNATVYFGSSDGNLYAVDADSGTLRWKFATNGIIHTSPAIKNGTVYIGSWDTWLYAIDAQTGKEKWKFKTQNQPVYHLLEGIQASPAVSDSIVFIGARDGYFYAINANAGTLLWKFGCDNSWVLTTAAIQDSTVYFCTSDSYLFLALDIKTGREKYRLKTNGYNYSSPAIAGSTAYFGDFTGKMYALDLNSGGKICTTFYTPGRKNNPNILNQQGNLDFAFIAGDKDPASYATGVYVMNQLYKLGPIVSSPVPSGNTLYFGSADSCVYAVRLKE